MKYDIIIIANYSRNIGQEDYFQEIRACESLSGKWCASYFTECRKFTEDTPIPHVHVLDICGVEADTGYHATQRVIEWQRMGYCRKWLATLSGGK